MDMSTKVVFWLMAFYKFHGTWRLSGLVMIIYAYRTCRFVLTPYAGVHFAGGCSIQIQTPTAMSIWLALPSQGH